MGSYTVESRLRLPERKSFTFYWKPGGEGGKSVTGGGEWNSQISRGKKGKI